MKNVALYIALVLFGIGCSAEPVEVTRIVSTEVEVTVPVEVTRLVETIRRIEVTVPVEVTRIVDVVRAEEVTRVVEVTRVNEVEVTRVVRVVETAESETLPTPTSTEEATSAAMGSRGVGNNNIASVENAGIIVEIARASFFDAGMLDFELPEDFGNPSVVGDLVLKISNNSGRVVDLNGYFDGFVTINDEQIALRDFRDFAHCDNLDIEILPGSVVIGEILFPVERYRLPEIDSIQYYVGRPWDVEATESFGSGFQVGGKIDLQYEEMPEDLERMHCGI